MVRRQEAFRPVSVLPIRPYELGDEMSLSRKDMTIIDFFLESSNQPSHIGAIVKGIDLRDRSGKKVRTITRKHAADRCRHLEEIGILEHVSRKPPRGAYSRTPHYYLHDGLEAFQVLVATYLNRGNIMRELTFMQSKYLERFIEKNIMKMLVRWLVPDEEDSLFNAFLLLLISRKVRRDLVEADGNEMRESVSSETSKDQGSPQTIAQSLARLRDVVGSFTTEDFEAETFSLFDEMKVFTEDQKNTYGNIVRLSPTALRTLVFLPISDLLEQYRELGIDGLFVNASQPTKNDREQDHEWRSMNGVIHELLYSTMMVDVMRHPFMIMRVDKRQIFRDLIRKAQRDGLPRDFFFHLGTSEESASSNR